MDIMKRQKMTIQDVKKDYETRINDAIDYVKDCFTVDEIEILRKLGYNIDTEE